MKFAYIIAPGRGGTNRLLAEFAQTLMSRGEGLCGSVQDDSGGGDTPVSSMDIIVLPDGPRFAISQNLGNAASGCRLNPDALERAVVMSAARLGPDTTCVIINKFGKQEAEGRGYRDLIAEALAHDIPVILGVNEGNGDAFRAFSSGMAEKLDADPAAMLAWYYDQPHPNT